MDEGQVVLKKISKIALAALGVLFVLAIMFYKERVFFADASYILFNIINNKSFSIQEHRYGSFITQMVPWAGQKLHLPIKALIVGYAVSFNLFYLSVAAYLVYRCRQYGLAVLMAFYYFLFVSDSYFWTNNEIHQAIAWMFLFFGGIFYLGKKQVNMPRLLVPFLLLAFLTVTTHFVAIIPTIFLWVYFILEKKNWPFSKYSSMLLSCAILAAVAIKYIITPSGSYDNQHLRGITHVSFRDIIYAFNTSVVKMFFRRCLTNYWCAVIVFIAGIASLLKNGEKLLAAWTIISCLGYIIIMGLTYADLNDNVLLFHIESEWVSLAVIAATPFVFTFLPKLKFSLASAILCAVFIIRLVYIFIAGSKFSSRIDFENQVLVQMRKKGIAKLAMVSNEATRKKLLLDWGVPFESLLMTAMDGDNPQLTFCYVNTDDKETLRAISYPQNIYTAFGTTNVGDFNKEYFTLDSTHPYQIMTYEELMK